MVNKELKILTVGNSFGIDTSEHVADVALSLGFERVKICVLYIAGCSLNMHYENARATGKLGNLCRDRFHLSYGIGRYIASLTFIKALTNMNIDNVSWAPDGVSDKERKIAVRSANAAIDTPYGITNLTI